MAQILSSILGSIGGVGGYFEKEIAQVTSTENNVNGQINYGIDWYWLCFPSGCCCCTIITIKVLLS
jgi:hypothetical protein